MEITPYLNFNGNCVQALSLRAKGLRILRRSPKDGVIGRRGGD